MAEIELRRQIATGGIPDAPTNETADPRQGRLPLPNRSKT